MKIKLEKSSQMVSEADIKDFEASLQIELPIDYKKFLLNFNGVVPVSNIFNIDSANDFSINGFIPLSEIGEEKKIIEDRIPERSIPIAWASGGNYVCLDLGNNAIFFYDHEIPDVQMQLAQSFEIFLELIEPFDIDMVELKPGQVKKAWIDPSLLE